MKIVKHCFCIGEKWIKIDNDIGMNAFKDSIDIYNVLLKDDLTVEASAFENCKNLTTVVFNKEISLKDFLKKQNSLLTDNAEPEDKKEETTRKENNKCIIQANAFKNCDNLSCVVLPNSCQIERHAFIGCDKLCCVVFIADAEIHENAFVNYGNLVFCVKKNKCEKVIQYAREHEISTVDFDYLKLLPQD